MLVDWPGVTTFGTGSHTSVSAGFGAFGSAAASRSRLRCAGLRRASSRCLLRQDGRGDQCEGCGNDEAFLHSDLHASVCWEWRMFVSADRGILSRPCSGCQETSTYFPADACSRIKPIAVCGLNPFNPGSGAAVPAGRIAPLPSCVAGPDGCRYAISF